MPADPRLDRLANATLLVPFESYDAPTWVLDGLADGMAGVCLFHNNIADTDQVARLNAQLGEAAESPLISLDEEGGDVTRIGQSRGSGYPGNAALGAVDDTGLTRAVHRSLGAQLRGLGFTMDLAPSADVNTEAENPGIGTRSFGADAALVSRHTAAAVAGLQEGGVAACAKHFPGHGATRQDSHLELPVVGADRDLLFERELKPFQAAIEAGVRSILTAHIRLPELGLSGPATLAPSVVSGLLRTELGFDGAIVTDAIEMEGVSARIGIPEAAVQALIAGCDLLCLGRFVYADGVAAIRTAITDAVSEGRLSAERLEEAAWRTSQLRAWTADRPTAEVAEHIGLESARRAVRVEGDLGPLRDPAVVEIDAPPGIAVGEVPWGLSPWFPGARRLDAAAADAAEVLEAARSRDLVVVVRDAHRHPGTRELVTELCRLRPELVVVEMGLPAWRPRCRAHISTYGAARVNGQSAAELLGAPAAASVG
ncbi:glycoside hydrolase family 3 protein [Streptomonospora wellingtoniae]|uniref:Glycoside hydrolase family 3 N-terminal domain-containing protein n=1 Tax=Streptomonospora wellingtoniae TaxID=3075544 RepID=A0ABU2KSI4_9ACTN|nr:glycoside hydrolase family 3 N-terminal domain-containing protein [Streptomonospora sp. DSM 45055]MDT0302171.1 glycoside hydrolase family 3 N-terminal domain-containing protein [Streptomonospora sp. DSM 45055]